MTLLIASRPELSSIASGSFRGTAAIATLALCLVVASETSTALADPVPTTSLHFNMQGTVCGPSCGVPLNVTYDFSNNNKPTSDPLEVLLGGASNGASVSGSADLGHLSVVAKADTQANPGSGLMLAQAVATWTEPFSVTSSTIAPGTMVQAKAVVSMDGIASVTGGKLIPDSEPPNEAATSAEWNFFAYMQNLGKPSDFTSVCADSSASECLLAPNLSFSASSSFIFSFVVGDVDVIEGSLSVLASAGSAAFNGAFASSSVTAFAAHTASFYLQPLDDFSLVSASGHDYSLPAPVPEPASILFFIGSSAESVGRFH